MDLTSKHLYLGWVVGAIFGFVTCLAFSPAHGEELSAAELIQTAPQRACLEQMPEGSTLHTEPVDDGMGDVFIWLKDKDKGLWLCDVNTAGAVFALEQMKGDILEGTGVTLGLPPLEIDPKSQAIVLCTFLGTKIEEMTVTATVEDGLGDYIVWLKNNDNKLWMCNAGPTYKLYTFVPVELPINGDILPITRQHI